METNRPTVFDLLQPHLLTVEELCEILHTRCVSKQFSHCNKDELVEIFKRVALPLPQRTFKTITRRGKILSARQKRKKSTIETPSFKTFPTRGGLSQEVSKREGESASPSSRIKPPIDLSSVRKVIKLNSNRKSGDDLEKIVINEKKKENVTSTTCKQETDPLNGNKHKKIKIDFSDSKEKSTPTPKLLDLKRPSSTNEGCAPKKKHKRIVI